ncbi:DNA-3-methyladenine glycosidase [Sporosarcina sp. P3]|uniref:DNA-3-methyladenine glycosylase family protein n=1 Tax=Sporosarcina sp. P3 TaxID=2048245 RepID=UPI000C16E907|nr:DNA-3-methyladenine glycosylase [Sporosarcina sp. P3]PID22839.1 DNA-3-methyladenine glycosidase [Sporosarcina sp. P3]
MEILHITTQDPAVQSICAKDPKLKQLISLVGDMEIPLRTDYLSSIVRSMIGQQISVQAASAIYARLLDLLGGHITVDGLIKTSKEELREVGLTMRKSEYVKDLADKIANGDLDLLHIAEYDDDAVLKQLINVKGIGKWTAEMFLVLSLGRPDVLAVDDVGIQRAAQWLYGVEKSERRQLLVEKSPLWAPERSIASHYLWEAIHLDFVQDYTSLEELIQTTNERK